MALLQMTEKKLAANRANARLSKGPITPAGKEKVSRNACRHHLCARKHTLPPNWDARFLSISQPLVDSRPDRDDPVIRALAARLVHLHLWFIEEEAIQIRRMNSYAAQDPANRWLAIARCVLHDPVCRRQAVILRRIGSEQDRTLRHLRAHRATAERRRTIPHLIKNNIPLKTKAASAGASIGYWQPTPASDYPDYSAIRLAAHTPIDPLYSRPPPQPRTATAH